MTTARDVIAHCLAGCADEPMDDIAAPKYYADADSVLTDLLAAPDSVRLELAALLPWRPIETAPKDREILVHCPATTILGPYRYIATWRPKDGRWITWGDEPLPFEPTHWLPLPAPPKEDKAT